MSNRNKRIAYGAGLLFGLGWWLAIDASVFSTARSIQFPAAFEGVLWIPGVVGTLGLVFVNALPVILLVPARTASSDPLSAASSTGILAGPASRYVGDTSTGGRICNLLLRLAALLAFTITFVGPILAGWFLFTRYVIVPKAYVTSDAYWPGAAMVAQTLLIFAR
ncbi:hypothetical protein BJ742DRAFT_888544 [Cladochytrium replicatum]|nr:hypothetical protein BJ742DRAFT_888544 [Cladochytrium replicatum]